MINTNDHDYLSSYKKLDNLPLKFYMSNYKFHNTCVKQKCNCQCCQKVRTKSCQIFENPKRPTLKAILKSQKTFIKGLPKVKNIKALFFFRGTFHNIFKLDTHCIYDCIGTSEKKFPKPPLLDLHTQK